jgi:uncharacterized protein YjbI with pentapeptide repeats
LWKKVVAKPSHDFVEDKSNISHIPRFQNSFMRFSQFLVTKFGISVGFLKCGRSTGPQENLPSIATERVQAYCDQFKAYHEGADFLVIPPVMVSWLDDISPLVRMVRFDETHRLVDCLTDEFPLLKSLQFLLAPTRQNMGTHSYSLCDFMRPRDKWVRDLCVILAHIELSVRPILECLVSGKQWEAVAEEKIMSSLGLSRDEFFTAFPGFSDACLDHLSRVSQVDLNGCDLSEAQQRLIAGLDYCVRFAQKEFMLSFTAGALGRLARRGEYGWEGGQCGSEYALRAYQAIQEFRFTPSGPTTFWGFVEESIGCIRREALRKTILGHFVNETSGFSDDVREFETVSHPLSSLSVEDMIVFRHEFNHSVVICELQRILGGVSEEFLAVCGDEVPVVQRLAHSFGDLVTYLCDKKLLEMESLVGVMDQYRIHCSEPDNLFFPLIVGVVHLIKTLTEETAIFLGCDEFLGGESDRLEMLKKSWLKDVLCLVSTIPWCVDFIRKNMNSSGFTLENVRCVRLDMSYFDFSHLSLAGFVAVSSRFDHCDMSEVSFKGVYFNNCSFLGVRLTKTQVVDFLCSCRLHGVSPCLAGADLSGLDLSDLDLEGVDLTGADLSSCDLSHMKLRKVILKNTTLDKADCSGSRFVLCSFESALMNQTCLDGVVFSRCLFKETRFFRTRLVRDQLVSLIKHATQHSYVLDLSYSVLAHQDLSDLNMTKVDLSYASLEGAVCFKTKFRGTCFYGVNLEGVVFDRADLMFVRFDRCFMVSSLFKDCQTLSLVFYDCELSRDQMISLLGDSSEKKLRYHMKFCFFDFSGVELRGMNLSFVEFSECSFKNMSLDGTSFSNSRFYRCAFEHVDPRNADFRAAQFIQTHFGNCTSSGTLYRASFANCTYLGSDREALLDPFSGGP